MMKTSSGKAVALLSGGLDSMLSVLIMLRQGIQVSAIRFTTPFDVRTSDNLFTDIYNQSFSKKLGFDITIRHLRDEMLSIVKNPKHGYGKNMNPCIDCRILMLKQARQFMETIGADFLMTGELLGQRPMSQRKDMLYHIDKEAGVAGLVVRPLSAKFLRVTIPEENGIIDREKLYGFSGRSRKPQMAIAREFGLTDYPLPAGGCLLTEPNFAQRLRDLLSFLPSPSLKDIKLLRLGRHFRYSPGCRIIVGRDKKENELIESLSGDKDCLLRVEGCGSPLTLLTGDITDDALVAAASLCARYSDARDLPEVIVSVINRGDMLIRGKPADKELIKALRIEKRKEEIPTA